MSSGVNMLANSLKISHNTKTELLALTSFLSDQNNDKNTAVQIEAVFLTL